MYKAAKVLKEVLWKRLMESNVRVVASDLSPQQHCFRTDNLTIKTIQNVVGARSIQEDHNHCLRHVVVLVNLDVHNACKFAK